MFSKLLSRCLINRGIKAASRAGSVFAPQSVVLDRKPQVVCEKLFINNKFVDAADSNQFEITNPATGEVIADVADASQYDVNNAVKAAKDAFQSGSEWRQMDPIARGQLLNNLADLIERDHAYIAALETYNTGKPFRDTYNFDIPHSIAILRYYANSANKINGNVLPIVGDRFTYTRREPVGVVGQIIPWNVPMVLLCWKIGPVVATGCTTVIKLDEHTPLSGLYTAKLIEEAGFPPGVINILSGDGPHCGAAIVRHPDVHKITFTGSTQVGKLIGGQAAKIVKRTTLELGGKSPNIVFADCDLDSAVEMAHFALFFNQSQCCCAGSRTYVQDEIYDEFVRKSVERAKQRRIGDPFDETTEQGPQISHAQMERVLRLIESGRRTGARLMTGGRREGDKGFYVQPTVFSDVEHTHQMAHEEVFGPVMQISKFKSIDEVIRRVNQSDYGLAASVFTKDLGKAIQISNGLRAASVRVNTYDTHDPAAPFGGFKEIGISQERGDCALDAYTENKCVTIKISGKN